LPAVTASSPFPDIQKGGRPAATVENAKVACLKLGISFAYDTFHNRKTVGGHAIDQFAGELSDDAVRMLRDLIRQRYGFDPGLACVNEAAITLCLYNRFDPVSDYLDGLKWDRVPRLDRWPITYLGCEDTALNRAIGRLTLIAGVRRVRQPGVKFDQIVVIEGFLQGKGKSTSIEILVGEENFSDQLVLGADPRTVQEQSAGIWGHEIAELDGLSRADIDKVKAFASRRIDRARPAYGRNVVAQPRTCICFATSNRDDYLKDDTGNRRFWPLRAGEIDLDALRRDRDQLWAEAAHYEAQGVSIVLPQSLWAAAAEQQEARREPDPWEDALADVAGRPCPVNGGIEYRVLTDDLFNGLNIPIKGRADYMAKRVASCMRRHGWTKPRDKIRIPAAPQVGRPGYPGFVPAQAARFGRGFTKFEAQPAAGTAGNVPQSARAQPAPAPAASTAPQRFQPGLLSTP
jgi:predicted P-loop ATPase